MSEDIQAPTQQKTTTAVQTSVPSRKIVDVTNKPMPMPPSIPTKKPPSPESTKPNIIPRQNEQTAPISKSVQLNKEPAEEPNKEPETPLKKYPSNIPWGAVLIAVFMAFSLVALSIFMHLQQS